MSYDFKYQFIVKEHGDGHAWIAMEPGRGQPPALKRYLIGFQLVGDATFDNAQAVARFLNEHIASFTVIPPFDVVASADSHREE